MRIAALSSSMIPFILLLYISTTIAGANNNAFQLISKHNHCLSCQQHVKNNVHSLKKRRKFSSSSSSPSCNLESFPRQATTLPKYQNSNIHKMLLLRGGETLPKKELITFSQHLAGSTFYFFAIMYGVACALAPLKTARFFYGYDEESPEQQNRAHAGKFLMRMIGATALGIGLTAAFAVGFELREGIGHMPSAASFEFAMGIGLVPRLVFLCWALVGGRTTKEEEKIPSRLRITKKDGWVLLVETLYFMYSAFGGKNGDSELAVMVEVAFSLLLGPLFFFKPLVLYDADVEPSRHEKLIIRLLASYAIMRGILSAGLVHPTTNALPAVGFTALAWVATLFHLTFVRKDVGECECSVPTHIAMMVCGVAVAAGGLHHYFTV